MYVFLEIFQSYFNSDEKRKEELKVVLVKETLPFYLDKLEQIAKENNEHLALSKVLTNTVTRDISILCKIASTLIIRLDYENITFI